MAIPFDINELEAAGACAFLLLFIVLVVANGGRMRVLKKWRASGSYAVSGDSGTLRPLSVIVCAYAGDAEALERNIPVVMGQDYPDFEVIVVDADNDDEVSDALTRLAIQYPSLRSTFIPQSSANVSKKKLAVTLGVKAAKNDFVLVTSAACVPEGGLWLKAMGRHFDSGAEIVIGHTVVDPSCDLSFGRRYRSFDRLAEAARYLAAAARGNMIRGNGNNVAYAKHLFYENKGFSSSLNLKYGDDDIFLCEMAERANATAIEISPESILTENRADYPNAFKTDKQHRHFTMRHIHGGMKRLNFESAAFYAFTFLALAAIGYAAGLYLQEFAWMKSVIVGGGAFVFWLAEMLVFISASRSEAKILGERRLLFCLPLFRLLRPIVNAVITFRASEAKNYTWE